MLDLKDNRIHPEMDLFSMNYVLRGFPPSTDKMYTSAKTLMQPWS